MSRLEGSVQVFSRQVYGQRLIYPACATAQRLADLAGVKSFNSWQLAKIRELGLSIDQVPDPKGAIQS